MNESITRIKEIIKHINILCPSEYNSQFTNEYYLENILLVLKYSNTIKSNKVYHYKTIHKKHILWSSKDVYYHDYNEMLSNSTINDITDSIIIDNTLIINNYESE